MRSPSMSMPLQPGLVAERESSMVMAPRQELEILGGTSRFASICLFVQAIVGGGLLTYPHAYRVAGVFNMLLLQMVLLIFISAGLWVLASCTERTGAATYQALMRKMLGRRAEVFCEVSIVVLIFGASCVYLNICVDQLFPWWTHLGDQCQDGSVCRLFASRATLTLLVAVFLSLLCLQRTMTSLSLPSLLGFGALLYVCLMIMANYVIGLPQTSSAQTVETGPVWWQSGPTEWLYSLPVICFSYQGHISAVPLYYELRRRSMRRWFVVISWGLIATVILYNSTGLLGYLEFLNSTDSDILKSFTSDNYIPHLPMFFVSLARVAVALAVAVTSAVFTFCARSAILDELSIFFRVDSDGQIPYVGFLCVTYAWVVLVAVVSILVPNIGDMVSIVGNVCAFFMFHFPGMCMIVVAYEDAEDKGSAARVGAHGTVRKWLALPRAQRNQVLYGWLFILVGSLVFLCGLVNAIWA